MSVIHAAHTIEAQALHRVNQARADLIQTRPFYAVLLSHVVPEITRRFPTAATNGATHYWNPEFVMTLSRAELLGVQAHELEHDARHHGTRRGYREAVEWNVCGDYSINVDLIAEGFTLPAGALIEPKYKGLSTEDIFRIRELDRQRQQPQPQEPDEGDEGEGDEDQPGDNADTDPGNEPGEDQADDSVSGDDADGDDADAEGDSQEAGEGDGEAGAGEGDEAGDEPGSGAGAGAGEPGEGEGEGGTGEGGDAPGGAASATEGTGDPGGCGEVLDAVEPGESDGATNAERDMQWDKIVRTAAETAKRAGKLPAHVTREIERANNPPRDWRDELREFAEAGALQIETWNRPNRRFIGRGLVLPGTQRDGINKAAFLIDTSGSCDNVALALVNDEAQALLDDGVVDQVVVVYGDTEVTRVDEYSTGDVIEFDPKGGGGTKLQPLFDHVADGFDASLIVCFTDLELYDGDLQGDAPGCPVLFAVHGYPQRVRQLMADAPWGARSIDVGAH